ncbi:MAG: family transcriptional regulator, cyclic receptor protein [Frankiaceae bacterium]|nr:family transcriptional regulator, cyclic receptor protein [Frankiaceae bacterium]
MEFRVLAGLDEDVRERLLRSAHPHSYDRGEVIFHEGDPADSMHVLLAGHVSVCVTTPQGDRVNFTVLGPGSMFGEMALLKEQPQRSATVTALEPADTLALPKAEFVRLRRTDPAINRFLIQVLLGYVRRQDERLVEALYTPADKRVLRRLLALAETYGEGSRGTSPGVVVPVTQEILAGLAGSTRPTTNQVLQAAAEAGMITLGRGQVRIDDPAALRRRAR